MSVKKIAEMAGVSPATVSRVLNNPNYRCSNEKIKEKIWNAAVELNYSPNQAARNLKLGKEQKEDKIYYINILMTRMDSKQTDTFFSELLRVIESEIHKGYSILTKVWYDSFFSNERLCRGIKVEQKVEQMLAETDGKHDGIIVIGKCCEDGMKALLKRYKNLVAVNRNSSNLEIDEVVCDGSKVATKAIEYLISLGHKKIAYVGNCHKESRYRGFIKVLQNYNLDVNPNWIVDIDATETNGYEAMEQFIQMDDQPTGIYFANDIMAVGALKNLSGKKRNMYRPSIIASDDIEAAQNCKPMLTTVGIPKENMGKFAVYLLLDRMEKGHTGAVKMELDSKLMIRNSCNVPENVGWSDYCI